MDPKSFGLGFGAGCAFLGSVFGVIHLVKKHKEKKALEPSENIDDRPDPPAPAEAMPEEDSDDKEEGEDEVPDEHELFRDLSSPYIPPPPEERSKADVDIYEINEDEFFLAQGAKKRFFTYYSGDGVLTDEGDEIVGTPEDYLGDSVYRYFCNGGRSTIHIRNNGVGCVIEVGAVPESYIEVHGGVVD